MRWLGNDLDGCDESISLSGHRLYEARTLGVILQRVTKLPDRAPDAVVSIEENAFTPNPRNDLVPGNNLVLALNQEDKYLQWDALHLQDMSAPTQPPGTKVKLITFAEPDRLLRPDWVGGYGTPPMDVKEFYNTLGNAAVNTKNGST